MKNIPARRIIFFRRLNPAPNPVDLSTSSRSERVGSQQVAGKMAANQGRTGQTNFGRERPRCERLFSRHKPAPFLTSLRGSLPPLDGMRFAMPFALPQKAFQAADIRRVKPVNSSCIPQRVKRAKQQITVKLYQDQLEMLDSYGHWPSPRFSVQEGIKSLRVG